LCFVSFGVAFLAFSRLPLSSVLSHLPIGEAKEEEERFPNVSKKISSVLLFQSAQIEE